MSQSVLPEILDANQNYVDTFGDRGSLALPPARRFAILTCMDARLDPAKYAGLVEGDAHVIRNAGGRASDDAIRSLVISYKLLGTQEFFVIHHTDCGMQFFTSQLLGDLLAGNLETAELTAEGFRNKPGGKGSPEGKYVHFLTITDPEDAVREDVHRIANHPLVPETIPVRGFIYDVKTGKLNPVSGAERL